MIFFYAYFGKTNFWGNELRKMTARRKDKTLQIKGIRKRKRGNKKNRKRKRLRMERGRNTQTIREEGK